MLQKGAAFLKHPHLALPLAAGLRHSGSAQRVFCGVHAAAKNGLDIFCGFRTANSVRLKKTVPNQRFGTVFLLFLGFFGGAEGLQALLDEVGDGAAADAVVMEENRQFGYLNPCTDDTVIRQKSGQVVAGGAIGVLCHEKIWFPTLPGNVMNAWTYNFPVQFQFLCEVDNKMIFAGEEAAYERILEGCKELLGKAEKNVPQYAAEGKILQA